MLQLIMAYYLFIKFILNSKNNYIYSKTNYNITIRLTIFLILLKLSKQYLKSLKNTTLVSLRLQL